MIRTATFFALMATVSLSAQTPPAKPPAAAPGAPGTTVTGCIAEVQRDGSLGPKATGTGATTPETAAMEANNPQPTNRYQLLEAGPAESTGTATAAKAAKTTYALRGQEAELAKHVGHRVQIAGSLLAPLASKVPAKAAETADGTRTVQVSSVKMLGTDCSPKK
jgi:hypothetical protein